MFVLKGGLSFFGGTTRGETVEAECDSCVWEVNDIRPVTAVIAPSSLD